MGVDPDAVAGLEAAAGNGRRRATPGTDPDREDAASAGKDQPPEGAFVLDDDRSEADLLRPAGGAQRAGV